MNSDGSLIREYIYFNSQPLAVKVHLTGQVGLYYFQNNHLGTPQRLVDANGTVVWEAAYLPFGKAQVITQAVVNNLQFPGQYYDSETGLHYNWHRYYDPEAGRYVSADPIGLAGGMNLYAYVENDPVNWVDSDGLAPIGFGVFSFSPVPHIPSPSDLISYHDNRNDFNQNASYSEASQTWNGDVPALLHQLPGWSFNWYNLGNQKYVSPDGKSELIFDSKGNLVSDCLNMGTYNYASPTKDKFGHFLYDMLPYFLLGNCPRKCEEQ